jgi:3D (Asp-Asp-Asp) domain-containing protein
MAAAAIAAGAAAVALGGVGGAASTPRAAESRGSLPAHLERALAGAAHEDTSKLAKEAVALMPRAVMSGKDKTCCGYPLVEDMAWKLTFYWLAMEDDFAEPSAMAVPAGTQRAPIARDAEVDLYTREGYFLARVSERYAWSLRMEGSGIMQDGRVVNYHGACNFGYGTCFQQLDPAEYPFGRGAGSRTLVPFKSVAVDPKLIPIGEPLYLPELDGIALPDGSIHDGCVRADDTGGAIKRRKLDFFAVTFASYRAVIDQLLGMGWVTPHLQAPRCEYLRLRGPAVR